MIKASVARSLDITIDKSSQQALQADGVTPLTVVGETHINLSRANKSLALDALVVEDLNVDILAGTTFLIANDVSVRPANGVKLEFKTRKLSTTDQALIAGLQSGTKVLLTSSKLHSKPSFPTSPSPSHVRQTTYGYIVTDASVTKRGLGATLYVTSNDHDLYLAGFFSAKLRKHQVTWLPCEIEALCIAAAVKHFSPFNIECTMPVF